MNTALFYLDPDSGMSLQHQIRAKLIEAIMDGTLPVGVRLPSSRQLAKQLDVSRNTVISAYQQLIDENYLITQERSGCYINPDILKGHLGVSDNEEECHKDNQFWRERIRFKEPIKRSSGYPPNWSRFPYPFVDSQFDPDLFPVAEWRECVRITQTGQEIYEWAGDCGESDDPILIEQIRTKLLPRRGISAQADEILVTVGSQQALFMIAHMLFDKNTCVGVERPGYADAANLFELYAGSIEHLDVDGDGLVVADSLNKCDYVYTTPSHQYPTAVTLSMERRLELLQRAEENDFAIIEDDYDCEANYCGNPRPALKSLDKSGKVIYVSSFSKILSPGLRLGFLVAPKSFVRQAKALRRLMYQHPPTNNQRAVGFFLSLGHYDALMRRLNRVHEERWFELRRAVNACFPQPGFMITPSVGGTACWIEGPEDLDAAELIELAAERGILLEATDTYSCRPNQNNCFRLSVTSIGTEHIKPGMEQLAKLIRDMLGNSRETYDSCTGRPLSIQELSNLLPGATLRGVTAYGEPYEFKLWTDGHMDGVLGDDQGEKDFGRWWFDGDYWWRQWHSWNYGESRGFRAVLDKNIIKWFDDQGDLVDTETLLLEKDLTE
ncbi:PLP-dependent aminotransferase family protein [bacterium SCSIO 12696]|nr:PLP-dependent aminotransferase family protein [bacterium SCSIO 12696]